MLRFLVRRLVVALLVGPRDLLFWAVLGNGSYVGFDAALRHFSYTVSAPSTEIMSVMLMS
mgnify:CR=1 FL=1